MSVRLILVGPPGAGKGTQAELLCESLGIPAISTGAIFRAHAQAGDELGQLAEPDAAGGFLLDGYPRNLSQVAELDSMLGESGNQIDAVLCLVADDDEVVQRLLGRAAEQGRVDDTETVIRHRIELYHAQTEPLVSLYRERGILVEVNGMGSIESVAQNLVSELKAFLTK